MIESAVYLKTLQAGEVAVHRMDILPQLRFEPEDMILTRRLACEESAHDGRLDLLVRRRGGDQRLLNAVHATPLQSMQV